MTKTVFRGISYKEALGVVANQRYERDERRNFRDGVAAKAVFGPGVYLLSDVEWAAHYAFCHAETESDLAAVMKQKLNLNCPLCLNKNYGEAHLREDALNWKYPEGTLPFSMELGTLQLIEWIGTIIKEYILDKEYDGIIYEVNEGMTYYVSYFPERQIKSIEIDFVFDINQLSAKDLPCNREKYKRDRPNFI